MMKSFGILAAAAIAVVAIGAAPAAAQARVPDTGMNAFGLTVGASMPTDDALENGVDLGVQFEHYITPRVSVRGKVSGAWFDIRGRGFTGTVHPIALEGNLVHNWEHGKWHPYATGGVGVYHYKFEEAGLDSSDSKFGVNFGGGAEYFFTRHDVLLGELQVRVVPGRTDSLLTDYETGYWTLGFGYKKYF